MVHSRENDVRETERRGDVMGERERERGREGERRGEVMGRESERERGGERLWWHGQTTSQQYQ